MILKMGRERRRARRLRRQFSCASGTPPEHRARHGVRNVEPLGPTETALATMGQPTHAAVMPVGLSQIRDFSKVTCVFLGPKPRILNVSKTPRRGRDSQSDGWQRTAC